MNDAVDASLSLHGCSTTSKVVFESLRGFLSEQSRGCFSIVDIQDKKIELGKPFHPADLAS